MLQLPAARAQDPADLPPAQGADDTLRAGLEQDRPYWHRSGPTRGFLAGSIEAGVLYFRPRLYVGYGKPHYRWLGLEVHSTQSRSGGSEYVGLRGVLPHLSVRVGTRYVFPVEQNFLPRRDTYVRADLETEKMGLSRYVATDAEINAKVNLPNGNLFAVASGTALLGTPPGVNVFEQSLRVVAKPPFLWRARLGYLVHIGQKGGLRIGAATETIGIPAREVFVVRAGPALSVSLTHHLEASAAIMVIAHSPDTLGLMGADLGQIGLRYHWATGDRFAEFP